MHRETSRDEPYVRSNVIFTDDIAANIKACRAELGALLKKLGYEDGRTGYTSMFMQTGFIEAINRHVAQVLKEMIKLYADLYFIRIRAKHEPTECFAQRLAHIGDPAAIADDAIEILNMVYAKQTHSHSYSQDHHRHAHARVKPLQ